MNILIVTSDFPFAAIRHGGGRLTFNWVKHLSRNHRLSLVSFLRDGEQPHLEAAREWFSEIHAVPARRGWLSRARRLNLLWRQPYPVVACHSRRMLELVRDLSSSGRFDLVQFEYFQMGQYLPFVPAEVPRVLVYHDVVTPVLRQQIRIARGLNKARIYREWELTRYWEKWYAIWAGNALALSLKDRRVIDSWDVGIRTAVLPPLLDPELFRLERKPKRAGEILFIGALHRPVNQDAVRILRDRILPAVRRRQPEARVVVIGAAPPAWLKSRPGEGFFVRGEVERIEPFLEKADVVSVPLRVAGGIIVKILQALAAAAPVVATRTANAGIGGKDGRDILLADAPEAQAAHIADLLDNPARADALGAAGQAFIRRQFGRDKVECAIDALYGSLAETG